MSLLQLQIATSVCNNKNYLSVLPAELRDLLMRYVMSIPFLGFCRGCSRHVYNNSDFIEIRLTYLFHSTTTFTIERTFFCYSCTLAPPNLLWLINEAPNTELKKFVAQYVTEHDFISSAYKLKFFSKRVEFMASGHNRLNNLCFICKVVGDKCETKHTRKRIKIIS